MATSPAVRMTLQDLENLERHTAENVRRLADKSELLENCGHNLLSGKTLLVIYHIPISLCRGGVGRMESDTGM